MPPLLCICLVYKFCEFPILEFVLSEGYGGVDNRWNYLFGNGVVVLISRARVNRLGCLTKGAVKLGRQEQRFRGIYEFNEDTN